MVWLGLEFNPANIVTLPLIIGIDVAFGVYIIDRYREDGKLSIFAGSTGKAIIMSSLTSLFGFSFTARSSRSSRACIRSASSCRWASPSGWSRPSSSCRSFWRCFIQSVPKDEPVPKR